MKKTNIFNILLAVLFCNIQMQAGRIYDEFEDIYKIKWIGNFKIEAGTTTDWSQRAGDVYRLTIDDPNHWSYLVYELPANETVNEVIVDFYSAKGLRPTLAVKNSEGTETKYVEGWGNGYPEIIDKGNGMYRFILKKELIPDDATQAAVYLDAQSDVELLRNIVYYGDNYQMPDYNQNTNYYRIQNLLAKAKNGENLTIGVIGGSITAGASAEPMATNCYGGRLKAWFESEYGIQVNLINAGIGSTNSYFGCIRAEEQLLRHNPDLIIVEYAVNDQLDDIYLEFYESLLRKCWKNPKEPAVVSLMLCTQAGISRTDRQIPIAQHYQIPVVSYNDVIKEEIIDGNKTWLDYYQTSTLAGGDGIHPNTAAHQKIADLVSSELLKGENAENAQKTEILPSPLYSNILEDAFYLSEKDITPIVSGTWSEGGSIWDFGTGKGWRSETANSELQFEFDGETAAVTYWKRPANENFGTAAIWVDNNEPTIVDGSNGEHIDQIVLKNCGKGKHVLHVKLLEDKKFEIVCIAVSGNRTYWNGQYCLENKANNLEISADNNTISMTTDGSIFTASQTEDGYICLNHNGAYLAVNKTDGTMELSDEIGLASKFLCIDKGEGVALRSLANGNYLSAKDNTISATATAVTENEKFLFKEKMSSVHDLSDAVIKCHAANEQITVRNAIGQTARIFDCSGNLLYHQDISENPSLIPFYKGLYLVQIGNDVFKCKL